MRKTTGRGQSAGLLDPEQASDLSRPGVDAETAYISDEDFDDTANQDADGPFLRARQRVPVRRRRGSGFLSRFAGQGRWVRVAGALIAAAALGLLAGAVFETKSVLLHNSHFLLTSTRNVQVTGNRIVPRAEALAVFAPDRGRSIFRVPLAERRAELEQILWVRRATVMRIWPNHLRVSILERAPVAFAREGNAIRLVDDGGVLLDLPAAGAEHYSFPVLTGIASDDPLATRAARMELYRRFVQALDAEGGHISSTLSEVDLSDAEDVRAVFSGPTRQPVVHFGTSDFLPRYNAYSAHLGEWLQQYPQLRSVDMRYGRQVVLDTGTGGQSPPASPDLAAFTATEKSVQSARATKKSSPAHVAVAAKAAAPKSPSGAAHPKKAGAAKHRARIHPKLHPRKHHRSRTHASPRRGRGHPVRHPLMHVVDGA